MFCGTTPENTAALIFVIWFKKCETLKLDFILFYTYAMVNRSWANNSKLYSSFTGIWATCID